MVPVDAAGSHDPRRSSVHFAGLLDLGVARLKIPPAADDPVDLDSLPVAGHASNGLLSVGVLSDLEISSLACLPGDASPRTGIRSARPCTCPRRRGSSPRRHSRCSSSGSGPCSACSRRRSRPPEDGAVRVCKPRLVGRERPNRLAIHSKMVRLTCHCSPTL